MVGRSRCWCRSWALHRLMGSVPGRRKSHSAPATEHGQRPVRAPGVLAATLSASVIGFDTCTTATAGAWCCCCALSLRGDEPLFTLCCRFASGDTTRTPTIALPDLVRASAALPFANCFTGVWSWSTAGASSAAAAALRRPSLQSQRGQPVSAEVLHRQPACSPASCGVTVNDRHGHCNATRPMGPVRWSMLTAACPRCSGTPLGIGHGSGGDLAAVHDWQTSTDCCMMRARTAAHRVKSQESVGQGGD